MPVSKGGTANNQNQNQFGAYTGNGATSQDVTGTTNQNITGSSNQNVTGSTSQNTTGMTTGNVTGGTTNTTSVNAPAGWETNWNAMNPGVGGLNPTQQTGVNWMTGALNNGDPANLAGARTGMNWGANYFQDQAANRPAPTLANLAQLNPSAYATPADVSAQMITARQGSEFMGDYLNPYLKDVVDTSLADFDVGGDRAANSFRLSNIGGGATGNGTNPVGSAILAGELARGRAATAAQLRSGAFNTAAGFGMQDAGRFLTADSTNAANRLAADTFNNQQAQSRNMFDAQLGMAYNDQRDRTVRDLVNTQGNIANLGTTGFNIGSGLANGLVTAGGAGVNQGLNWLNAGTPLMGQTNTGTVNQNTTGTVSQNNVGTQNQNTTGTQNQNTTGSMNQNTTGTTSESGTTSGNSSGSARGKSGGLSLG